MIKKIFLASLVALIAQTAQAESSSTVELIGLGMRPEIVKYLTANGIIQKNNTWVSMANATPAATPLNVLKLNASNNVEINAISGKVINLDVAKTPIVGVNSSGLTSTTNSLAVTAPTAISLQVGTTPIAIVGSTGLSVTGLVVPTVNEEAVAGAGSTVSDAAALSATKHIHQLTGANGTLGWKFATSAAGQVEFLLNTTAGVPKVYAASGGTCNGGAADAACTLVTGIVSHICYSTAADTWICS